MILVISVSLIRQQMPPIPAVPDSGLIPGSRPGDLESGEVIDLEQLHAIAIDLDLRTVLASPLSQSRRTIAGMYHDDV